MNFNSNEDKCLKIDFERRNYASVMEKVVFFWWHAASPLELYNQCTFIIANHRLILNTSLFVGKNCSLVEKEP